MVGNAERQTSAIFHDVMCLAISLPGCRLCERGRDIMTFKKLAFWGAVAALTGVAACGGDSSDSGTSGSAAPSTQQTAETASSAGEVAPAPAPSVALPTTPLNRDALFGLIAETIVETAPCPFLSDSTAIATADTNYEMVRREVSNEECRWSKNAGFSIRVSVAPIATATPLKDRAYNLDTPPVLKEQAGPGANAVILYDTAWDKERPYAMGFEQGDKLVEIFVTGMETDPARLTATAEEVAAELPTAPTIEKQYREIKAALDFCTIWSDESLGSLFGITAEESLYSAPYGQAGCKWNSGYGANAKSVTVARYKQGDTKIDRILALGGQAIPGLGDRAVILTRPAEDGSPGDSAMWVDVEDQQFILIVPGTVEDHASVAQTLMENLFSRI